MGKGREVACAYSTARYQLAKGERMKYDVIDICFVKQYNNFSQDEIELCCMIANRFTGQNLVQASFKLQAYLRKDKTFPTQEIKDFVDEWLVPPSGN